MILISRKVKKKIAWELFGYEVYNIRKGEKVKKNLFFYVISRCAHWGFNFVSLLRELMCLLALLEEILRFCPVESQQE